MAGSTFGSKVLETVAATNFGQFFIKKIDAVLSTLVQPAKYCVDGAESKGENRKVSWPVFWIVLIYMQTFRVVFSTVFSRIESKDIVSTLQRWRRMLRAVRFRGLRKIRESKFGKEKSNGNGASSGPSPLQPNKKRNLDDMLEDDDYNLLDDLMNRTFTDSDDDMDPTFVIANGGDGEYKKWSSPKSKNESRAQGTLPTASDHHESSMDSKSNEATFVSTISTVDDTEESAFVMTEDDSTNTTSANEEARTDQDSNKKPSTESTAQTNGTSKRGKESLNEPVSDPADAMMSKFVEMEQNGKLHLKKSGKNQHGSKKKRNQSLTTSQENVNRQKPVKESKSQESIDQL